MGIKVYTAPFCPYCEIIKDLLNRYGFSFQEIDVQDDPEAAKEMIRKSGQDGTPVVEVDGKIIVGADPEKILEALSL